MNAVSVFINLITWLALLILVFRIRKGEELKPIPISKTILVFFIGLFSFSINLPFMGENVQLAILPLGVWILYWVLSKRNEGKSWKKYRKYAWIGFLANFIFLLASVLSNIIDDQVYPKKTISTYIGDWSDASLIQTHPTGKAVKLDSDALSIKNFNFRLESIYSEQWYNETFMDISKQEELFPYILTGTKPKWGSGIPL